MSDNPSFSRIVEGQTLMLPSPKQVRAARGALGWSAKELGKRAGLVRLTVARFENGGNCGHSSVEAIARVLVQAGIRFTPEGLDLTKIQD